jgi:hypothetical protein
MEPFESSTGHFLTYDAFAAQSAKVDMFNLQCASCGFEPENCVTPPKLCPKCHGTAWERYARPGSILDNAKRF